VDSGVTCPTLGPTLIWLDPIVDDHSPCYVNLLASEWRSRMVDEIWPDFLGEDLRHVSVGLVAIVFFSPVQYTELFLSL
jgi:hypothetical protein